MEYQSVEVALLGSSLISGVAKAEFGRIDRDRQRLREK
jgi:hypothetical protein